MIEAVAHTGNGLVDLWEASPVRLNSNEPNTDKVIDLVFPGNPLICCGWTRHQFDTRARTHLVQAASPTVHCAKSNDNATGSDPTAQAICSCFE